MCARGCGRAIGNCIGTVLLFLCCWCEKAPRTRYQKTSDKDYIDDEELEHAALRAQRIAIAGVIITTIGALVSIASLGVAIYITQENKEVKQDVSDIHDHFGL